MSHFLRQYCKRSSNLSLTDIARILEITISASNRICPYQVLLLLATSLPDVGIREAASQNQEVPAAYQCAMRGSVTAICVTTNSFQRDKVQARFPTTTHALYYFLPHHPPRRLLKPPFAVVAVGSGVRGRSISSTFARETTLFAFSVSLTIVSRDL